ncbi:MAG TPA: 50S ribosomal protein L22, partial [Firmicutes bacterium]|nr:50S ribosomal protein L22 [Bacillota bacterium]
MEARATAKYIRMSPRKARLVVDQIRGRNVRDALAMLKVLPNKPAEPIT